ncbi:maltokinase N-terminal cap-like domain-containing protein [Micromonospora sp. MS34]|uniref:maltokinase N-terminal cap-like domain-containing protein n=1 Tax=Micromonospora sp. MS34 TaxID=3385971 RepID=UPI0039A16CAE
MAIIIHRGATLTPYFDDFLPGWVARQPWYRGTGVPELTPVGYFRFADPAGAVGLETHLLRDGSTLYQVPLTYRDAPLDDAALVATAEHSVLGTRWINDATADPVWIGEVLRLVATGGVSEPSGKRGVGPAEARGRRRTAGPLSPDSVRIELRRVLTAGEEPADPTALGVVTGNWHPDGPDSAPVHGCLAVLRPASGTAH